MTAQKGIIELQLESIAPPYHERIPWRTLSAAEIKELALTMLDSVVILRSVADMMEKMREMEDMGILKEDSSVTHTKLVEAIRNGRVIDRHPEGERLLHVTFQGPDQLARSLF